MMQVDDHFRVGDEVQVHLDDAPTPLTAIVHKVEIRALEGQEAFNAGALSVARYLVVWGPGTYQWAWVYDGQVS